jgi:hypothetical protein
VVSSFLKNRRHLYKSRAGIEQGRAIYHHLAKDEIAFIHREKRLKMYLTEDLSPKRV